MHRLQFPVLVLAFTVMVGAVGASWAQEAATLPANNTSFVQEIEPVRAYVKSDLTKGDLTKPNLRWWRSIQVDGTIYMADHKKTTDGGRTISENTEPDLTEVLAKPEYAVLVRPGLFFAATSGLSLESPDVYSAKAWRSSDDLKTLQKETAIFELPGGPTRESRGKSKSMGLSVFRTILPLADGTWLATLEGTMAVDTIKPTDHQSSLETPFRERTIVVSSGDEGHTWKYLSTVAYPRPDDPVGEGFVEPALMQLADGRLLCVMRTGHHFPLYSCWSSDQGKTWTRPLYTGLERGCDPCLLRLRDGRILLTYGKRFPEGWSHAGPNDDFERFEKEYPAGSQLKMAISEDGSGSTWQDVTIARHMGTCYSCIFEVEPNVIFCQVDGWCLRVHLKPKQQ